MSIKIPRPPAIDAGPVGVQGHRRQVGAHRPRLGGIEAARKLRDCLPATRIVFLTVNEDPHLAAEAFHLGASAWVLKASTATELAEAVRAAVAGRPASPRWWREGTSMRCLHRPGLGTRWRS